MRIETVATIVKAPKEKAFRYLSDIGNLPRWATEFCRKLDEEGGKYYVNSPQGRVLFEIRSNRETGVIDFMGGPSETQLTTWPARVIDLSNGESAFLFTAIQEPPLSDGEFEGQLASLRREMENVRKALE